jgi:hypothetical protein
VLWRQNPPSCSAVAADFCGGLLQTASQDLGGELVLAKDRTL